MFLVFEGFYDSTNVNLWSKRTIAAFFAACSEMPVTPCPGAIVGNIIRIVGIAVVLF